MLKFRRCERCDGVERVEERETTWQIVGIFEETLTPPTVYVNNSAFTRAAGGVGRANTVWVMTAQRDVEFVANVAQELEQQFKQADLRIKSAQTIRAQYEAQAFHFNIMTVTFE